MTLLCSCHELMQLLQCGMQLLGASADFMHAELNITLMHDACKGDNLHEITICVLPNLAWMEVLCKKQAFVRRGPTDALRRRLALGAYCCCQHK